MKEEILRMLATHEGKPVSGQEICKRLKVSRTAVWKTINSLKEEGYSFDAVTNKGYSLLSRPDILTRWEIASRLKTKWAGRRLEAYFRSETSTNNILKKMAEEGAPEGTLVVADIQEGGKGRRGREWVTPPPGSNIAMSLLVRPEIKPKDLAPVTLVAAMSVCRAVNSMLKTLGQPAITGQPMDVGQPSDVRYAADIGQPSDIGQSTDTGQPSDIRQSADNGQPSDVRYAAYAGQPAMIKWPNDIVLNGGKLTGILTELSLEEDRVSYVVIGIGINVNNDAFPEELAGKATSLYMETGQRWSRAELVARVLEYFEELYGVFEKSGFAPLSAEYEKSLAGLGKKALVMDRDPWEGTIAGITESGEIMIRDDKGCCHLISSGEISVRGINGYSP